MNHLPDNEGKFTLYAILNHHTMNLWQTVGQFDTEAEAEAYGHDNARAFRVDGMLNGRARLGRVQVVTGGN